MILPFLGFPSNWDTTVSLIIGILIVTISYMFNLDKSTKEEKSQSISYIEHKSENL
jgi:hypothetical protein